VCCSSQRLTVRSASGRASRTGRRTIKGKEGKREFDAGEDAEEEEVQLTERLEQRETLLDGALARDARRDAVALLARAVDYRLLGRRFGSLREALSARLGQGKHEEERLGNKQDNRQERRCSVDVQLEAKGGAEDDRARRKVCTNGRPNAEANREGDAHVRKRLGTRLGRCDIGKNRAVRTWCL
jgi:hypothetical protein